MRKDRLSLRRGLPRDFTALGDVMFDAVRHGPSPYTHAQRRAWVPHPRRGPIWAARLVTQIVFVVEDDGGIAGFMSLDKGEYIDFAYLRRRARGKGGFRALHDAIENAARDAGATHISTHASLMARAAFETMGHAVVAKEVVQQNGEELTRFEMRKTLPPNALQSKTLPSTASRRRAQPGDRFQ